MWKRRSKKNGRSRDPSTKLCIYFQQGGHRGRARRNYFELGDPIFSFFYCVVNGNNSPSLNRWFHSPQVRPVSSIFRLQIFDSITNIDLYTIINSSPFSTFDLRSFRLRSATPNEGRNNYMVSNLRFSSDRAMFDVSLLECPTFFFNSYLSVLWDLELSLINRPSPVLY